MKKLMMAMMALTLVGMAGAQTKYQAEEGYFTFKSCTYVKEGLRCDLTFTPKKDYDTWQVRIDHSEMVTTNGNSYGADAAAVGGPWSRGLFATGNVYAGVPTTVSFLFTEVPDNLTKLAILKVGDSGVVMRGVPVGTPAPVAAPKPTTTVNTTISGYNATLSGCKTSGTTITCSSAILTPKK